MVLQFDFIFPDRSTDYLERKLKERSSNYIYTPIQLIKEMDIQQVIERSKKIREIYHQLERQHHGNEWSVEEDALAFLTDAGLVGRYTMSQQGRWPVKNTNPELGHKLGECIWWLAILADRMDIDFEEAVEKFLTKTENLLQ